MKDNCILTAESVTEGHPDKLCDTIADAVVDACLTRDAAARVACEVMATAGKIIAAGEITAAKIPDIPATICRTVREAGYGGSDYEVEVITHEQSPDIAEAVCGGTETGAGDQGILYGFACDETKELLPLPVVLAHRLARLLTDTRRQGIIPGLRPDGKAQVSVEYRSGVPYRVAAVVVSCQHEEELPLPELRRDILRHVIRPAMQELPLDEHTEVLVNPSGRFVQGGFEADTGLTGRKLMVDTYGGLAPHGGGALSGKDYGLTDVGKEAVRRMQEKGMLLDVSHLNDNGFWDLVKITQKPFVASHSNSRALCSAPRNLTDDQLRAIRDVNGVVGLNAFNLFIDDDPKNQTVQRLAEHAAHMIDVMGIDHVGCGFDFFEFIDNPDTMGTMTDTGSPCTKGLANCSEIPNLFACFEKMGMSKEEMEKIARLNFQRVVSFQRSWRF